RTRAACSACAPRSPPRRRRALRRAARRRFRRACGAAPARSSARPGERAEVVGIAVQLAERPRSLLRGEAAVDIERHREVFLARSLERGGIGRITAALPVGGEIRQALPGFLRADHGKELGLQALVVAVAELVEQRRTLGVLRHALELCPRQSSHPVLQPLRVALGAALAPLALVALQVLPREPAVVFGEAPLEVRDLL